MTTIAPAPCLIAASLLAGIVKACAYLMDCRTRAIG